MLVKFSSSETGEFVMLGSHALDLLRLLQKDTESGQGAFLADEMLPAASCLRQAVAAQSRPAGDVAQSDGDEEEYSAEQPGLGQRAWPLIDMLERTARSGEQEANILWCRI